MILIVSSECGTNDNLNIPIKFTSMKTINVIYLQNILIFTGKIQQKGLIIPTTSDIYVPILKELKKENIEATETTL